MLTSPSIHRSAGGACIPSGARLPYKGSSATSARPSRTTGTRTSPGQRAPVHHLHQTQYRVSSPRPIHRESRGTSRENHWHHRRHCHCPDGRHVQKQEGKNEHARKSSSLRRDEAKTQFLRVMYGGRPDTLSIETRDKENLFIDWTPPEFLRKFYEEFRRNSTTLLSLDEFKTYLKDIRYSVVFSVLLVLFSSVFLI